MTLPPLRLPLNLGVVPEPLISMHRKLPFATPVTVRSNVGTPPEMLAAFWVSSKPSNEYVPPV